MEKKANLLTFWWRLGQAKSPSMPLIWRLFILKLMLNRTRISVWYTDEEKVAKLAISIEMVKSYYNDGYIRLRVLTG